MDQSLSEDPVRLEMYRVCRQGFKNWAINTTSGQQELSLIRKGPHSDYKQDNPCFLSFATSETSCEQTIIPEATQEASAHWENYHRTPIWERTEQDKQNSSLTAYVITLFAFCVTVGHLFISSCLRLEKCYIWIQRVRKKEQTVVSYSLEVWVIEMSSSIFVGKIQKKRNRIEKKIKDGLFDI